MGDSRRSAERMASQMQYVVESQKRIIYFLISVIVAFLVTYFITVSDSLTTMQEYVMFILILAVALWMTEAVPPFAVGILIVGLLIFSIGQSDTNIPGTEGYIDVKVFVHTWSNSVIWLMLGGFFLAEALRKTGLDKELFRLSISLVKSDSKIILFSLMMSTAIASMVMSNTATTAMMIASITPFVTSLGKKSNFSKALLVGIPAAAAIGGMGTIIGSPPNAIAIEAINNFAREKGVESPIGFLEWMILGVPIAITLIILFWMLLIKVFKLKNMPLNLDEFKKKEAVDEDSENFRANLKFQKRFVLIVLAVTVLLWLTSNIHHIPAAAVSGLPIILLPMIGVLLGEDIRELPWDTLMLVAGGLSLGLAIQESGLAQHFVEKLSYYSFEQHIIMIVFAFITVLLSNIMSNTATATILIPIASIIPGTDPIAMACVIGLSASCALFLPVSTPPNAIAFSTGYLKQSDFRLGGTFIGLIGPVFAIGWVLILTLLGFNF